MAYINGKKILQVVKTQFVPAVYQEKTISPANFQREVVADSGYAALSKVKINGILIDPHTEIESQTDTDIKYQKTVPAGALRYAGLNKLGGMSYKFNQLVQNGNFVDTNNWTAVGARGTLNASNNVLTYTIVLPEGTSNNRITQNINFVANHKYLVNLSFFSDKFDGVVIAFNGGADSNYIATQKNNWNVINRIITVSNNYDTLWLSSNGQSSYMSVGDTFSFKKINIIDLTDIYGVGNEPTTYEQFKATFNKDYYDYTAAALHHSIVTSIESNEDYEIPAEVQALSGYGMGVNADCYNYIDFETKKFKANALLVDLGTLNWKKSGSTVGGFYVSNVDLDYKYSTNTKALCSKYNYEGVSTGDVYYGNDNSIKFYYNSSTQIKEIYVLDTTLSDLTAEQFKATMSGVYLVYELATPVETDISQYIDQDTLDLGDYITFNNEYQQAVPSSITYLVEV